MVKRLRAVSLLEMLVVLVIISILMGIMLPVMMRAKSHAVGGRCITNLQQIHRALAIYSSEHGGSSLIPGQGAFPPNLFALKLPPESLGCKGGGSYLPLWGWVEGRERQGSHTIIVVDVGASHRGSNLGLYADGSVQPRRAEGDPTTISYWD